MAGRAQRTKITAADSFGNPAIVKDPNSPNPYVLGMLIGRVDKLVERKSPKDGEIFEGLGGHFLSIPSDPALEEIESGVLFIPDAFHNVLRAQLKAAQAEDPAAVVEFTYEVASIRANNPAGYSWQYTPGSDFQGTHPLRNLIQSVGVTADRKPGARMITGPSPRSGVPASDTKTVEHQTVSADDVGKMPAAARGKK